MENYIFNNEQLQHFMSLTSGMMEYQGNEETFPVFDDFCQEVFGDDWSELIGEWDGLFEMEFEPDTYYYISTDIKTPFLNEWIKEGKEILSEILENLEY